MEAGEEPGEWRSVQMDGAVGAEEIEAGVAKQFGPLRLREIGVRERDAVRAVADPIHEAEGGVIEGGFGEMVLDEDEARGDAGSFTQERERIEGVVKDVDEEADVEGSIGKWKMAAVEGLAIDGAVGAGCGLDAVDVQLWHGFAQKRGESAIAAADVEQTRADGKKGGEAFGENGEATAVHDFAVDDAEESKKGFAHAGSEKNWNRLRNDGEEKDTATAGFGRG